METGLSGTAAVLGFAAAVQRVTGHFLAHCPRALQRGRFPGLPDGAALGSGNRIRGLLAWSSHPNPAGRGKVRLGQKALAVRARSRPADLCAGSGDGAPAADPSLLPCGWSRPPAGSLRRGGCLPGRWHVLPRRGPEHAGRWARERWHSSPGRQRDELIHRLGAAAVQQSSCFPVKSPTPCLEKTNGSGAGAWPSAGRLRGLSPGSLLKTQTPELDQSILTNQGKQTQKTPPQK